MNTITLLGIEVPIRQVPAVGVPFVMIVGPIEGDYRRTCLLWLENITLPETAVHKQERALLTRMLLNTMVWGKTISQHQSLDSYRDLPMARANMIGLYEQMFAKRQHPGVFADIPPGDDGEVYLLNSGHRYSVFSDSIGAAKRFCLRAMEATFHKELMEAEGLGHLHRNTLEKLKDGCG